MDKSASAPLNPKRQRSQYTCMATSLSMCLEALDIQNAGEDDVNKVMGAAPMQGASWEQAFAAAQHFGARTTLICPATLAQVKAYTDRGVAVMIAWNPEGRPWSHASVIYDVDDDNVYVADPNIPDPDQLVRVVPKAEFYGKWYEKWDNYLVRRPAMAVEREISPEGRQMVASTKDSKTVQLDPARNPYERERGTRGWGAGGHQNREKDVDKGRSRKEKHKQRPGDKESADKVAGATLDNLTLRVDADTAKKIMHAFHDSTLKGSPHNGFTVILDNPKADPRSDFDQTVDVYFTPDPMIPGGFKAHLAGSDHGDVKGIMLAALRDASIPVTPAKKQLFQPNVNPKLNWVEKSTGYGTRQWDRKGTVTSLTFRITEDNAHGDQSDPITHGYEYVVFVQTPDDEVWRYKDPLSSFAVAEALVHDTMEWWKKDKSKSMANVFPRANMYVPSHIHLATYSGNPGGKPIYPNEIDHGYDEPLAGGTDVMRRLQNQFLHEQGTDDLKRPESPRLASMRVADAWWGADTAPRTPTDEFITYMNANAVRFPKGPMGWWLPAHNLGVRLLPQGKVLVLQYRILPPEGASPAFMPGKGIVLSPHWGKSKWAGPYTPSMTLAQKLSGLAGRSPTIMNTVKGELNGLEGQFGITIPAEITTKLSMNAAKNAIARWAVPKIQTSIVPV